MKILSKIILLGLVLLTTQTLSAKEAKLLTLTDANYMHKLLQNDKPVLVKFWASWCKPCRKMSPEFKKASKTFKGKVTFAEVNVDKQKQLSLKYSIHALPTMILFNKGRFIKKSKGSMKQNQIEKFVQSSRLVGK